MINIPTDATIINIQVIFLTSSLRANQPIIAAKKGAAANKNIAFATDVICIDIMLPEKAKTKKIPPTMPAKPVLWIIGKGFPLALKIKTINNNGVSPSERKIKFAIHLQIQGGGFQGPFDDHQNPAT
jgi:hypothetical protein